MKCLLSFTSIAYFLYLLDLHCLFVIVKVASSSGVPVIMDAGGVDAPIDVSILSHLSVFSPNETELSRLTGIDTSSSSGVREAASMLLSEGIGQILVKLGSRGSMLFSG